MTIATLVAQQKLKKRPFCTSQTTVFDAAVEISEIDVNALAVVDDGTLVGIITDHDIIRCLADSGPDFSAQSIKDWMTKKPLTCTSETKLTDALKLMAGRGIRHLPVVEDGKATTVISSKELLTRIHENDELEIGVLRDLARVGQAALA
ncbi:CBS domain-containing protein [Ruegeria arenilitoris]|uniref:CBS domain-containing protein n=1 Tax=Ruegeria arenilitoris TaxID=1173585 RepID=UPI00147F091A|nr:CBS domain-containing protein [Ruegeria arenilitoris]